MTLCLVCIVWNSTPTAENAKAGCSAGNIVSGHTACVPGMRLAAACAKVAQTI